MLRVLGGMIRSGVVALAVIACVAAACDVPADSGGGTILEGLVVAGPVCPVVTQPPDPNCEDRPVAGAEIVVRNAAGESVARVRTAEDGTFSVPVGAGRYELLPQPAEGLLGTPGPLEVVVVEGVDPEPVTVVYDTGIR